MSAERAKAYLNDPLIKAFDQQTKDALFHAFQDASERDTEHLKNLCLMAKSHKKFMAYLQSFIDTEKVEDFHKKTGVIDSVSSFIRRNTK